MRDAGGHSPHFFLQNFLNLSFVMRARTDASVAYLATFGWLLDDVSAVGLLGAVFGLAACSELGLETCSLILRVGSSSNETIDVQMCRLACALFAREQKLACRAPARF